jgi:energy-coupling factor transporter transmembrane protein EcfT
MMSDYTITDEVLGGRYCPGDSPVHQINPTVKIWAGMLMIFAVALSDFKSLLILTIINLICLKVAGLTFAHIFRGLRHFTLFFFVLILFPAIFSGGSPLPMPTVIPFQISVEGLEAGGIAVLRFIAIILISMILTRTIHPIDIVRSMENIISKKYFGEGLVYQFFKVGVMSMQIIPYLFGEIEKFGVAHKQEWSNVRGIKKYSRLMGLMLPFLIHIFQSMNQIEELIEAGQEI